MFHILVLQIHPLKLFFFLMQKYKKQKSLLLNQSIFLGLLLTRVETADVVMKQSLNRKVKLSI